MELLFFFVVVLGLASADESVPLETEKVVEQLPVTYEVSPLEIENSIVANERYIDTERGYFYKNLTPNPKDN